MGNNIGKTQCPYNHSFGTQYAKKSPQCYGCEFRVVILTHCLCLLFTKHKRALHTLFNCSG